MRLSGVDGLLFVGQSYHRHYYVFSDAAMIFSMKDIEIIAIVTGHAE